MKKKALGGLFGALAAALAALVAARGGGSKPVPAASVVAVACVVHDSAAQPIPGAICTLGTQAGGTNQDGYHLFQSVPVGKVRLVVSADGYHPYSSEPNDYQVSGNTDLPVTLERARPVVNMTRWRADGRIFRQGDEPVRWRGVTAFGLLNLFAKGKDISGFLADFAGYNVLRVFLYVPVSDWKDKAWDTPTANIVLSFLERVAADGFYTELVLLTDDDPARLEPARQMVAALSAANPPNLFIEIGNEPTTHKHIDTPALRPALEASPFLYTSGDYEDEARWFGRYGVTHTKRDDDWPRRAHDLMEFFGGNGPETAHPPYRVPWVADEPIRPDQASRDRERDFLAYFGTCSLLGAGATYHFESGKYGNRPNDDERRFAAIALKALMAFPADAPNGQYSRPVEASLRTYVVGNSMVRVRPWTTVMSGWASLDGGGVLWSR